MTCLNVPALMRAIRTGVLDRIAVPPAPLDILAQQMVAAAATQNGKKTSCSISADGRSLSGLTRSEFDQVLRMLADGIATNRGRGLAYLFTIGSIAVLKVDVGRGLRRSRRRAIPDTANYAVVAEPEARSWDQSMKTLQWRVWPGTSCCWVIRHGGSRRGDGQGAVEDAHGAPPNIPFWRGEARRGRRNCQLRCSSSV